MRSVDFVTRLIDEGKLSKDEYKRVSCTACPAAPISTPSPASSRLNAEWSFFKELRDLGGASAKAWLRKHYNAVGLRLSLDLRAAYS